MSAIAVLEEAYADRIRELETENQRLKIEIARLKLELDLLRALGRNSSPPF